MASDEDADSPVGAFIRRQREMQELTMRQLADMVGISNPYLSQIERGLRDPSEKVLGAIADQLHVSAETLQQHVARTRRKRHDGDEPAVAAAIRADPDLTPQQRRALLAVYEAFTGRRAAPSRGGDAED